MIETTTQKESTMYLVRPLFNTDRETVFSGFGATSALVASRHVVQATGETPLEAAEQAFAIFNRDDRPNGYDERSLSVSDVVQVMNAKTGDIVFASVESVGFQHRTRIEVIRAIRRGQSDAPATRDERPSNLGLYAAMTLADTFLTPENAIEKADDTRRARIGI